MQHLFGDAAQKQPRQSALALGGHHDQIGLKVLRGLVDLMRGVGQILPQHRMGLQPRNLGQKALQHPHRVRALILQIGGAVILLGHARHAKAQGRGVEDMQKRTSRRTVRRKGYKAGQSVTGLGAAIGGQQHMAPRPQGRAIDHQHRAGDRPDRALGRGAQKHVAQDLAPVRADHQQIRLPFRGRGDNPGERVREDDLDVGLHPVIALQRPRQFAQHGARIFNLVLHDPLRPVIIDDMDQIQPRPVAARQQHRPTQRPVRAFGEIRRQHDPLHCPTPLPCLTKGHRGRRGPGLQPESHAVAGGAPEVGRLPSVGIEDRQTNGQIMKLEVNRADIKILHQRPKD